MGAVNEKSLYRGLFGGLNHAKNGKTYLSVMEPGPKVHKIDVKDGRVEIPQNLLFGTPINVQATMCEQKFQDFNGSFAAAESVIVVLAK